MTDRKKLILVNSYGPMAASLVGGLLEKLGPVQLPVRDLGLNDYLLGRYGLNCGEMQKRLRKTIRSHSGNIRLGGVSMLDRDSQAPRALVDADRVEDDLDKLEETTFECIQDLYWACRDVYRKAVTYKSVPSEADAHVEYPTDFGKNWQDAQRLYEAYVGSFDDVRVIHMHRKFENWVNSIASQKFAKPSYRERLKFKPRNLIRNYKRYEAAVRGVPGLHLNFEDLFDRDIEDLAAEIREFCDLPRTEIDFRSQTYDLYGKATHFDVAFKPFDDGRVYLDESARRFLARCAEAPGEIGRVVDKLAWTRFAWCFMKYRLNHR